MTDDPGRSRYPTATWRRRRPLLCHRRANTLIWPKSQLGCRGAKLKGKVGIDVRLAGREKVKAGVFQESRRFCGPSDHRIAGASGLVGLQGLASLQRTWPTCIRSDPLEAAGLQGFQRQPATTASRCRVSCGDWQCQVGRQSHYRGASGQASRIRCGHSICAR